MRGGPVRDVRLWGCGLRYHDRRRCRGTGDRKVPFAKLTAIDDETIQWDRGSRAQLRQHALRITGRIRTKGDAPPARAQKKAVHIRQTVRINTGPREALYLGGQRLDLDP